ncbi:hypothetical protein P7B02_06925 [Caulobacter segnis]|uniref:hypothetical protein n=1 Tax=Caulobacter segnis TaxID=88688 RepID=UPI00241018F9|nr:hypothetical protein [Caulobacter segnis]MDG2521272.1 hypothetical protein [Caulobacter segnis]
MLLAALLMFGLAQEPAATARAQITPACAEGFRTLLPVVGRAMEKQTFADARTKLDSIAAGPCKDDPAAAQTLPIYAADLSLREGKFAQAIKEAGSSSAPPQHPLWPFKQLTVIAAHNALGETDAAKRQLVVLLQAHFLALSAKMKPLELFKTDTFLVQGFEGLLDQGIFKRKFVFVAVPKDGGMPQTLMLTNNIQLDSLEPENPDRPWMLDRYACHTRTTVKVFVAPRTTPGPDYETVKAEVITALSEPFGEHRKAAPGVPACGFAEYVLPGYFSGGR